MKGAFGEECGMTGRVEGKVALITGGARGMGAAHARRLAAEGAKVVIGDILEAEALALAQEIGAAALFVALDVASAESWASAIAAAEVAFGPLTILVNNAAIFTFGPLDELSEADYRRVVDVNQVGVFLGMKAAAASMKKAGGGAIVNISSTAGLFPFPQGSAYSSTKHAVTALTKVGAIDLGPHNIRVNSVHPGLVDTPMVDGLPRPERQPIPRAGRPEEVANLVLFLASDEASYCTGGQYLCDGGYVTMVGDRA